MPISDIPILSMLRTRMQWHQERQQVLAENVANADTPNYRARDLAPPNFEQRAADGFARRWRAPSPVISAAPAAAARRSPTDNDPHYEVRPRGNAVSHEDEMLKLAGNQMDYDAVTSIYTHSLGLIKTGDRQISGANWGVA